MTRKTEPNKLPATQEEARERLAAIDLQLSVMNEEAHAYYVPSEAQQEATDALASEHYAILQAFPELNDELEAEKQAANPLLTMGRVTTQPDTMPDDLKGLRPGAIYLVHEDNGVDAVALDTEQGIVTLHRRHVALVPNTPTEADIEFARRGRLLAAKFYTTTPDALEDPAERAAWFLANVWIGQNTMWYCEATLDELCRQAFITLDYFKGGAQ